MSQFKPGDRVVIDSKGSAFDGRRGVVVIFNPGPLTVVVAVDDYAEVVFNSHELVSLLRPPVANELPPIYNHIVQMGNVPFGGDSSAEVQPACVCPLHGPDGLMAKGCSCGALKRSAA